MVDPGRGCEQRESRDPDWHRAWIALGSNLEPEFHFRAAIEHLKRHGHLLSASRIWQTKAVGDPNQPDYLNAVVLLETTADPIRLKLVILASIEQELHRVRDPGNPNAARTIDLDVVLYDDQITMIEHRRIPDPDILVRPFLATPLAEISPDYRHPETGERLEQIASRLGVQPAAMWLRDDLRIDIG